MLLQQLTNDRRQIAGSQASTFTPRRSPAQACSHTPAPRRARHPGLGPTAPPARRSAHRQGRHRPWPGDHVRTTAVARPGRLPECRPLEHADAVVTARQLACSARAIRLYSLGGNAQQPRRLPGVRVRMLPLGRASGVRASKFRASASHTCGRSALATADSRLRPQAAWPRPGPTTSTEARSSTPISWLAELAPRHMTSGRRARLAVTCSGRVATLTSPRHSAGRLRH